MSSRDPTRYSEHDTDKALDRLLSDEKTVFTCKAFEKACPSICASCPFRHTISTPLQLGREKKKLIKLQSQYFFATEADAYFDINRLIIKKSKDFAVTYAHEMPGENAHTKFVSSPTAPKVDTVMYSPGHKARVFKTERGVLIGNTYNDDGVVADEGDWSLWREHFEFIVPNDEGQLDHLLNVISHTLQRPSQKVRHAVLLKGGQRTGKSTIAKVWAAMLGPSNIITVSKDELESTFQGGIYNKQLAVFEELFIKGRDRYNDLKELVSEEEKRAQKKNVDFYTARTPFAILALSNHDLPLMIPEKDDGRWFIIDSKASRRDQRYYDRLNSEGIKQIAALKQALLNRDIQNFNPNSPPPLTVAKERMISESRTPLEKALEDMLSSYESDLVLPKTIVFSLPSKGVRASESEIRDELRKFGGIPLNQVRWGGQRVSPWAWRNTDRWAKASDGELASELDRARSKLLV